MNFLSLLLSLSLGALVKCSDWCYHGCAHTPSHWADLPGSSCGESHQSPIDIDTRGVVTDPALNSFTFINFSSQNTVKSITNNGHSVQCSLAENEVELNGGGLNGTYSAVQFHFHWGDTEYHPGSEHTIDGHRYPMEMHIVTLKKGMSADEAKNHPDGLAVLGFFINATDNGSLMDPWSTLMSNLTNISVIGDVMDVNYTLSIDDLIGNVDRTKFYRYYGSLTTPDCNKAVVWTIFHEPIQVHKDLIQLFPTDTSLINVYRPTQQLNGRQVTASPGTPLPPTSSHSWCHDAHCEYDPPHWYLLPDSHCGGQNQSPINIDTNSVTVDETLSSFTFTNFDNKQAIKSIMNTGHSVKCVLKDNLVEVSGGGLKHVYSTLQFHLHWGTEAVDSVGSEHTVDSHRYPMELHIVNKRKDLTLDEALVTSDGLAVLGFFIEAPQSSKNSVADSVSHPTPTSSPTSDMTAWTKVTQYLSSVQNSSEVEFTDDVSIDDLLGSVSRDSYYRYSGSLTTPSCNEVVVWTVFKETVKVDQNLMMMFPHHTGFHDVFRPAQPLHSRTVYTTTGSASRVSASFLLYLLLACLCSLFR